MATTGYQLLGGDDLTVADGGTGASTFTNGGVLIGNDGGAIQVTTAGAIGQLLTSNGVGVDPTFQAVAATTLTGDVTGTGAGSFAATIANDAVTYAKIQNVSDTDKLLGRSSIGAGDVEEIACTAAGRALIDDTTAAFQRDTLGLGTMATQAAASVAITGGTLSGITALTVSGTLSLTNASPFSMTNGQVVTVALTAQTVGVATLTIPDFANVNDTFVFITKAATLSNKTFVAPALGAATATTINKVTITAPTTAATLTLVEGSSLITSGANAITLTSTGGTNVTLPTSGTLVNTGVTALTALATVSTAITGVLRADAGVLSADADVTDIVAAATTTASGKIEIAIASEINTGTDATRAVSPDSLAGSNLGTKALQVVAFDFATAMATGNGKAYATVPSSMAGMDLVAVHARVITAGTTGTCTIQIANVTQAADMLTTLISIDSAETGSDTAAVPAVIDAANDDVASYDLLRVDVDTIHTTAALGLIITLEFRLP